MVKPAVFVPVLYSDIRAIMYYVFVGNAPYPDAGNDLLLLTFYDPVRSLKLAHLSDFSKHLSHKNVAAHEPLPTQEDPQDDET